MLRKRRVNQCGRVAGGRRCKKSNDRFSVNAAEQKDQALGFGRDTLREIKASVAKLLARQPVVAAIVIDRRQRLKARDQRKKSAAGEVPLVHCNRGRDRFIGAVASNNEGG